MDLYSRETRQVGRVGTPGGVAVRFAPNLQRLAYVSDSELHCIHAFDVDSRVPTVVAGSTVSPTPGYIDGGDAQVSAAYPYSTD